jgi:hypothetical protein
MSDTTQDNVIDMTAVRLIRHYEEADTETEAELALTLIEAYDAGAVAVEMVDGELLFSLPALEEGPVDSSEGATV